MSSAPTSTPSSGLEKLRNSSMNQGSSARGLMALDMMFMSDISSEKPIRILPTPRLRSLSLPII